MDIVTHAMLGSVLASPMVAQHPLLAAGFVLGSVLPDLDSLSRIRGKDAFLRSHQTLTHSLFFHVLVLGLGWLLNPWFAGVSGWLATGVAIGMVLHSLLDLTNTLGVMLLAPWSWRRYCLEWVFFVDLSVLLACAFALGMLQWSGLEPIEVAGGLALWMLGYWSARAVLARRARRLAPTGTVSLIPSPLWPWVFLGFWRERERGENYQLSAVSGAVQLGESYAILDTDYQEYLDDLPEYRAMAMLSPAYHIIAAAEVEGGVELSCRDLRTRPVGTRFGDLAVLLDHQGAVRRVDLNV